MICSEQDYRHPPPWLYYNDNSKCFIEEGLRHGNLDEEEVRRLVLILKLCVCQAWFWHRLCSMWWSLGCQWHSQCISTPGKGTSILITVTSIHIFFPLSLLLHLKIESWNFSKGKAIWKWVIQLPHSMNTFYEEIRINKYLQNIY